MSLATKALGGITGGLAYLTDRSRPKSLFTRPGKGISNMEFVPRVFTGPGVALAIGLTGLASIASDAHYGAGASKVGRVSYADGPAKMTKSFTSGAVEAMNEAANGDYAVFSEMAAPMFKSNNQVARVIDDYGANPAMIRSVYGMR